MWIRHFFRLTAILNLVYHKIRLELERDGRISVKLFSTPLKGSR
ncbi:hypothetical protein PPOLYM_02648 [Paenibacillus polymyxa]|nr:hypothetical protein [Paenibacillus sp. PvR133]QYK61122.1 hypothetical protein KAI37_01442 [Paenibacillus sp. S25]VUG06254.1 hypothetical protein PPOLYM_02648 [Paenibacillus polymyxa]